MDKSFCPNCNSEIKESVFGSNLLLNNYMVAVINEFLNKRLPGYCEKCGRKLYGEAVVIFSEEKEKINSEIESLMQVVPIVTTHSPNGWVYNSIGIVTGQSTTGTGIVSEFTSTFTDLFGSQSNALNNKLRNGENFCFNILRKKCLELGGNAVIAADVDYSEVGGGKGILMVCSAGTAVLVKNFSEIFPERLDKVELAKLKVARLNLLNSLNLTY
ncbi:MAG: heavy metal-binding domain-containing protein [Bacteroidetes bacterium]|nr:heavy metal-binding domain-containing protein [Bacteroidota bacterium]